MLLDLLAGWLRLAWCAPLLRPNWCLCCSGGQVSELPSWQRCQRPLGALLDEVEARAQRGEFQPLEVSALLLSLAYMSYYHGGALTGTQMWLAACCSVRSPCWILSHAVQALHAAHKLFPDPACPGCSQLKALPSLPHLQRSCAQPLLN